MCAVGFAEKYADQCLPKLLNELPFLDALVSMEKAMNRDMIIVNDRQLACARISSQEGQDYLKAMCAAGNYAWVNRSSMTFLTRQVTLYARCNSKALDQGAVMRLWSQSANM